MSIATAEEITTLEEARLILRRAYKSGKLGDWRGLVASNASESLRLLVEILENERRLKDFLGVEDGPLPGEVTHGDERFLMVKGP